MAVEHTFEEVVALCQEERYEIASDTLCSVPFTMVQALELQALLPEDVMEPRNKPPGSVGIYEVITGVPDPELQLNSERKNVIVHAALFQNNVEVLDHYFNTCPHYFDDRNVSLFLFELADVTGHTFGNGELQIEAEEVPRYRAQAAWYVGHALVQWEEVPEIFHPVPAE